MRTRSAAVALCASLLFAPLGPHGLVAAEAAAAFAPLRGGPPRSPPSDHSDLTVHDDRLVDAIRGASSPDARIAVEIVTSDEPATRAVVGEVGGIVTGTVPGAVVQASVAAGRVDALAAALRRARVPVSVIQSPRRISPKVAAIAAGRDGSQPSFGPVGGDLIGALHAGAWHDAGARGAVKIGIVDYFDLGLWRGDEHGPEPTEANGHVFCLDTAGLFPSACPMPVDGVNDGNGDEHGVAVAEVVKDVAPDAELYIATVGTTSDLSAAIDWFASNGVAIVTRSLGTAYDGPGDGTGPLATVVDHAADLGITWFNSAGNEADGRYGRFTGGVTSDGYVDFDNGSGVDTSLTITALGCLGFTGIRWANDWGKPAADVTDYAVEVFAPFSPMEVFGVGNQAAGDPPLEMAGLFACGVDNVTIRLKRSGGGDPDPDVIEVGLSAGRLEAGRSTSAYSGANPVVDSRNPSLISVGAVDPPDGGGVAAYSSRGPTNDGRVKPDVVAPSCVTSTIYTPAIYGPAACFNGTSAASPAAAGFAALLLGRGLAIGGPPLAALVRHLVVDLGPPGPDNDSGAGLISLPAPPPDGVDARPAQIHVLPAPERILDTRAESATAGAPIGPFAPRTILDLPITAAPTGGSPTGAATPITAVAVTIVSVGSTEANYVQALPTLVGRLGAFANLNVATPGQIKPNFAIVPVGAGGAISLYLPTGGDVVVDLMATFSPAPSAAVTEGRYVPVPPTRALDTRTGPVPAAGSSTRVAVPVEVPDDATALVLNVTSTGALAPGFLRVQAAGAVGLTTANGNFVPGIDSGTMSIVPFGVDHEVEVYASAPTHVVADVTGYITGPRSPTGVAGLFVPITPVRASDSRAPSSTSTVHVAGSVRTIQLAAGTGSPIGARAISANVATDQAEAPGFVTIGAAGSPTPVVSNLNFPRASPISNAGLLQLSHLGAVNVFVNRTTHVIIDVNGYFTGNGLSTGTAT